MALGDPYAQPPELEARLNRCNDGWFADVIDAASRAVEAFTRRQFNRAEEASARRFRAVDPARLPVDDFHTTSGLVVAVDGVTWGSGDVDPRPWNGIVNGQPGWPFFDLFAVDRSWPWSRRATVTVTARWGWPAVPEGIRQATLDVATVMLAGVGGETSGPVRAESIDGYSVSYQVAELASGDGSVPPELRKAIPYRRRQWGVA